MSIDKINEQTERMTAVNGLSIEPNEGEKMGCCNNGSNSDGPRGKLHCFNWLGDIPGVQNAHDMVEVQFKNTRKGFYKNSTNIPLEIGDWVAVEASPGHDIGQVTLIGALVKLQMTKARVKPDAETRRVFRKAKPADMEKFEEAKAKENSTMIKSRKIAEDLKLNMKIGDVEYQGDGNKAIFYYIADERVDFRQLIKVLADEFKVRIEMKQIGARQEAGRIGGIGPCGRPLCCASWMSNFVSVATSAARFQDISLNPQKLAGQCAKLKCCLNFEVDAYVESVKRMPARDIRLETVDNTYFHFKTDIFKRLITYSTDKSVPANLITIDADRAFEVIALNKAGEKPLKLDREGDNKKEVKKEFGDIIGQDSVTRFDKKNKKSSNRNRRNKSKEAQPQSNLKQGEKSLQRQQVTDRRRDSQIKEHGDGSSSGRPQRENRQRGQRNFNKNRQNDLNASADKDYRVSRQNSSQQKSQSSNE